MAGDGKDGKTFDAFFAVHEAGGTVAEAVNAFVEAGGDGPPKLGGEVLGGKTYSPLGYKDDTAEMLAKIDTKIAWARAHGLTNIPPGKITGNAASGLTFTPDPGWDSGAYGGNFGDSADNNTDTSTSTASEGEGPRNNSGDLLTGEALTNRNNVYAAALSLAQQGLFEITNYNQSAYWTGSGVAYLTEAERQALHNMSLSFQSNADDTDTDTDGTGTGSDEAEDPTEASDAMLDQMARDSAFALANQGTFDASNPDHTDRLTSGEVQAYTALSNSNAPPAEEEEEPVTQAPPTTIAAQQSSSLGVTGRDAVNRAKPVPVYNPQAAASGQRRDSVANKTAQRTNLQAAIGRARGQNQQPGYKKPKTETTTPAFVPQHKNLMSNILGGITSQPTVTARTTGKPRQPFTPSPFTRGTAVQQRIANRDPARPSPTSQPPPNARLTLAELIAQARTQ